MALVVERDPLKSEQMTAGDEKHQQEPEEDLEDGEIEDDEDEVVAPPQAPPPPVITEPQVMPGLAVPLPANPQLKGGEIPLTPPHHGGPPPPFMMKPGPGLDRSLSRDRDARAQRRNKHIEDEAIGGKKVKHMTEAEKSILHLRKRERMQREKWEKFRKEQESPDDFAINIEKAIANALKKDKQQQQQQPQHQFQDEDERIKDCIMMDENTGKRGRKRKNRDKDKFKNKQRKIDSPLQGDLDENEFLNMRGGSPSSLQHQQLQQQQQQQQQQQPQQMMHDQNKIDSPPHSTDSYNEDSELSSDRSPKEDEGRRERKRDFNKKKGPQNKRNRDRDRKFKDKGRDAREKRTEQQLKDAQGFCVFFMQGKCQKNDCPYSHEVTPPMKLELCKFYLKDCCAKGEKCSYMHSEFPCKFYHTGLPCLEEENCKFAHGKALNEGLRQILYKHIETAPREILGGFPRMSREEALDMINNTQSHLAQKYGQQIEQHGGNNSDKEGGSGSVGGGCGLFDMNMSGPVELSGEDHTKSGNKRNRPSRWQQDTQQQEPKTQGQSGLGPVGFLAQDQDMRISSNGDIDMRTLVLPQSIGSSSATAAADDASEQLDNTPMMMEQQPQQRKEDTDIRIVPFGDVDIRPKMSDLDIRAIPEPSEQNLPNLPKTQRDLYLRIQATQKDNLIESKPNTFNDDDNNINWYSDDSDDEDKLTIKVDNDESGREDIMSPPQVSVGPSKFDLGDLSKIDISVEVTKLLSAIKSKESEANAASSKPVRVDPRIVKKPSASPASSSTEEKLSIYEQGSLENEESRTTRPDVDLRNLALPFKGMANYTPAKEIDASVNSHKPIAWVVHIVDIPRPDYGGLKLNISDAEKTGDPRLRKIFRLSSTDEKDSPMSPKASPKASTTVRIDPRLKRLEVEKQSDSTMNYTQQLNILTSSAFFQSLTSNQKLLLNQELASRNEQNGLHDPVLNSMLSTLNLIPNLNQTGLNALGDATALSILQSVNKLNPIMPAARQNVVMNQMAQSMVQPGLLGAAPGIPNLPPDFSINFDPRNGGLLGNAPPPINNNLGNAPPFFQGPGNEIGNAGNFQSFPNEFPSDDYYDQGPPPQQQNQQNQQNFHNRNDNRGFNRDRRRGRNNFRNNNNRNNFNNRRNNNRNNRNSP